MDGESGACQGKSHRFILLSSLPPPSLDSYQPKIIYLRLSAFIRNSLDLFRLFLYLEVRLTLFLEIDGPDTLETIIISCFIPSWGLRI